MDTFGRAGVDSGIEAGTFRELGKEVGFSLAFLPALRKPRIWAVWLGTARRALVALATVVVFMVLIAPPVAHWSARQIDPPKVRGDWMGLEQIEVPDPRAAAREKDLLVLGWLAGGALVGVLLALHLPIAVVRAGARAIELEREGDRLVLSDRAAAREAYEKALGWATDREREKILAAKISRR